MTWRTIVNVGAGLGGIIVANRVGCKLYGDEKITNPIEAAGYIALLFAAAGVAANTMDDLVGGLIDIRNAVKTEPKKEEETETEPEEEAEA